MLLFVIRHGDPIYNPDSLTPKGHLQANALAKRFAIHGRDKIYSSPVNRAKLTAQPTADILSKPVEIEEWTSESLAWQDFAVEFPNGRWGWIFDQPNYQFLQNGDENLGLADWQKAQSVQLLDLENCYKRISAASDEFLERHGYRRESPGVYRIINPTEERIAIFCHQGFSNCWFPHLLGIPPHIYWSSFDINHSGVSVFEFRNYESGLTSPKCINFSDCSHLLREGLPYQFQNRIDL